MLTSLSIKNYALIEEAHLRFDTGFTVITGETGAGKSILLGALGLITGKRADSSSAGDPTQKCIIEGVFDVGGYELSGFFNDHDLDYESATIVRREITASGKSRSFINDTPVTLQQLSALGRRLVDIHSQHKTLDVVANTYQFEVLDTFANANPVLSHYKSAYKNFQNKVTSLKVLKEKKAHAQLELEYQQFLFSELDEVAIKDEEFEKLEVELKTLSNAEEISNQLEGALHLLSQDELGVLDQIATARSGVQYISKFSDVYNAIFERLHSVHIELDDVRLELVSLSEGVIADPLALERMNNRAQLLYNLMQKHKVATTAELVEVRDRLDAELQSVLNADADIAALEGGIAFAKAESKKYAAQLHKLRKDAVPQLQTAIIQILQQLGMENARFEVQLASGEELLVNGMDSLEFLFTANIGMGVKPLGKGASGGELSRVMLAIKSVLSRHKQLPTLIFDEIDTGVSGEVAVRMGAILKKMGMTMQLMSITHLPQIAGQGATHFKVYKKDEAGKTKTEIVNLNEDERVVEIAEMLGGAERSEAAIAHAKNLLN